MVLEDKGLATLYMYRSTRETLLELFSKSKFGKIVTSTGHYEDIVISNRVNIFNIVLQVTQLD